MTTHPHPLDRLAAALLVPGAVHIHLHTQPPPPHPDPTPGYARASYPFPLAWPTVTHYVWPAGPDPDEDDDMDTHEQPRPPMDTQDTTYRHAFKSAPTPEPTPIQRQGDVLVLPWPPATAPAMRAQRVAETVPLADTGCAITPGPTYHALLPDAPHDRERVRYAYVGKGHTLGTLVVEDDGHARLTHPDHPDLVIGPGVYVLHR